MGFVAEYEVLDQGDLGRHRRTCLIEGFTVESLSTVACSSIYY
jgi:hypothetical protein